MDKKSLHKIVWLVQIILAAMFLVAGVMKTFAPIEQLAQQMPWAGAVPPFLVRLIGFTQLLGAVGLILPSMLRIIPVLTVWAAAGLLLTMVLAFGYHLVNHEMDSIGPNIVLGLLAGFVVWGRLRGARIESR